MTDKTVTFYLDPGLRQSAEAGEHNFIAKLGGVLTAAGYRLAYRDQADAPRAATDPGYGMVHMAAPVGPRCLTFRRAYHYPFWQIETTAERWRWTVAKTTFSGDLVPKKDIQRFYGFWRKRLFGDLPDTARNGGFVYVPLQGKLRQHRSFQSCAPIKMLEQVLIVDPVRPVRAALHPNETYDVQDHAALSALQTRFPQLTIQTGGMEQALTACDYVVTMNSAAAFSGYFFAKPCILFGEIDFHHIALRATPDNLTAFHDVMNHRPDYAAYLWWFWQHMSINAGRPEAADTIRSALIRCGWPL